MRRRRNFARLCLYHGYPGAPHSAGGARAPETGPWYPQACERVDFGSGMISLRLRESSAGAGNSPGGMRSEMLRHARHGAPAQAQRAVRR
jgi:hypothetical protein